MIFTKIMQTQNHLIVTSSSTSHFYCIFYHKILLIAKSMPFSIELSKEFEINVLGEYCAFMVLTIFVLHEAMIANFECKKQCIWTPRDCEKARTIFVEPCSTICSIFRTCYQQIVVNSNKVWHCCESTIDRSLIHRYLNSISVLKL